MEPLVTTVAVVAGGILLKSILELLKEPFGRYVKRLDKVEFTVTKKDGSEEKVEISMKEKTSAETIKKILAVLNEVGNGAKPQTDRDVECIPEKPAVLKEAGNGAKPPQE